MSDGDQPSRKKRIKVRANNVGNRKISYKWVVTITIWTFFISTSMQLVQMGLISDASLLAAFFILAGIVAIGVVFDIIGVAVTAASEVPFHSLCTRQVRGAAEAVRLIRNAEKVGSFCNDVIGDIASIISGSATGAIVASLLAMTNGNELILTVVLMGCVAALTIGGKALGKGIAILKCNAIVFMVGKLISFVRPVKRKKKK